MIKVNPIIAYQKNIPLATRSRHNRLNAKNSGIFTNDDVFKASSQRSMNIYNALGRICSSIADTYVNKKEEFDWDSARIVQGLYYEIEKKK